MDSWLKRAVVGATALAAIAGPAGAATLIVDPGAGCGKATCFNDAGVYTRTWSAKDFTGSVNIANLLVSRAVLGALDTSTFRISFTLNGQELGTWGRYNMGGIGGDTLSFSGQELVWDPEDGDLVLTLSLDPAPKPGGGGFGSFSSSPSFSSFSADPPSDGEKPRGPPPPSFRESAVDIAAVPEPATWALMILGFGAAGTMLRARRRPALARVRA